MIDLSMAAWGHDGVRQGLTAPTLIECATLGRRRARMNTQQTLAPVRIRPMLAILALWREGRAAVSKTAGFGSIPGGADLSRGPGGSETGSLSKRFLSAYADLGSGVRKGEQGGYRGESRQHDLSMAARRYRDAGRGLNTTAKPGSHSPSPKARRHQGVLRKIQKQPGQNWPMLTDVTRHMCRGLAVVVLDRSQAAGQRRNQIPTEPRAVAQELRRAASQSLAGTRETLPASGPAVVESPLLGNKWRPRLASEKPRTGATRGAADFSTTAGTAQTIGKGGCAPVVPLWQAHKAQPNKERVLTVFRPRFTLDDRVASTHGRADVRCPSRSFFWPNT